MFQLVKKYPFALNLNDGEIQALQLTEVSGSPKIAAHLSISLDPDILNNGEILKKDALLGSLQKLFQDGKKIPGKECLLSLPESQCSEYIFYISKELKGEAFLSALEESISATVPLPLTELVYDFAAYEFQPIQVVYTVMAKKSVLQSYRELLQALNIKILRAEPASLSLLRNLLDFEIPRSSIIIFWNGNVATWYLLYAGLVFDSNTFTSGDPNALVKDIRTSHESFTKTTGQRLQTIYIAGSSEPSIKFVPELETFLPVHRCEKHLLQETDADLPHGKFSTVLGCALQEFPKFDKVSKINLFK